MPRNKPQVVSLQEEKPTVRQILGVQVHAVTTVEALFQVRRFMTEPRLHQIATVNPEFVMAAQQNAEFRQALNSADLCIPDGVGLLLAGRWLGQTLPERVAGSDLVYHLAEQAAASGWRLFLLGAAPGVADEAANAFQARYAGLDVAGTYAGSPAESEDEEITRRINDCRADLLYVAYGAPKQDLWIARNRPRLATVRVAIGVGGALDFVAGRAVRAPAGLQKLGLEWLFRLYREPWRWRRMLALPRFAVSVLRADRTTVDQ